MTEKDLDVLTACRNCPTDDIRWMFSLAEWEDLRRIAPAGSPAYLHAVAVCGPLKKGMVRKGKGKAHAEFF